jgi:hypothetical protein
MRTLVLVVAAVVALGLTPVAAAGPIVDRAAAALESSPVYSDPGAEKALTAAETERVRSAISANGNGPIYVAVLPAAAADEGGGDAAGVIDALHSRLGRGGVYAVVVGSSFRAASTDLAGGEAGRLATAAIDAHRSDGVAATLVDFVGRVGDRRAGGDSGGDDDGGTNPLFGVGLLPLLVLGGIGFFLFRTFRRRRAQDDEFAAVKEAAREDLVALAEDVQELDTRVSANPAAKRDYDAALEQYSRASGSFDRARTPEQLEPVAAALEEGRYLMASAEARLEGARPPERRPACFFDPRHGPSVRDVEWSPDGGRPRAVPACAACALRVEEGVEPESRQVLSGGRMMPYWAAGPMYGGYFGGFFPGLILGEMLGGFGGLGWGGPVIGGWDGGGDGGGDWGGDFGGGGGDFGGGGGGGDF